jgi:hypothetical protein
MQENIHKTRHNWHVFVLLISVAVGTALFLVGLFANHLGMDTNEGWGIRRVIVLTGGELLAVISVLLLTRFKPQDKVTGWAIGFVVIQCILIYWWYGTAGTMSISFHGGYYDLQAQAFLKGQLDLLVKPSPELLALSDPYDPNQNGNLRLHDALLYHNKYYLYWGPFPAMILAGVNLFINKNISDSFLVILFLSGYVIFMALTAMEIRRHFFPAVQSWILVFSVLIGGLMNPILWLLARPAIYEAAIAGGQCFLFAGIYLGLITFRDGKIRYLNLALCSFFLAGSVLTRINLAPAVVWAALCIAYIIWMRSTTPIQLFKPLLALGIPLTVGALILFSYNALRFGSPFDVGMQYQLAGIHVREYLKNHTVESPAYIFFNLASYFFYPVQKVETFPFITSAWHPTVANPDLGFQFIEPVAGVMTTTAFFWFLALPVVVGIFQIHHRRLMGINSERPVASVSKSLPSKAWVVHLFAGLAVMAFLLISLLYTSTMRYIFDFAPSLYMLAVISLMQGFNIFKHRLAHLILIVFFLTTGIATIVNGILLGFIGYENIFSQTNPNLFQSLTIFFSFLNK